MEIRLFKIVFIYLVFIATYSVIFFSDDFIRIMGKEDGPIENLGALSFAVASILFFIAYFYSLGSGNNLGHLKTNRNIFYLLLGILFLICCGEETSWGQRIFNLETPQLLKEINSQDEISFHNLWLFQTKNPDGSRKTFMAMMLNMSRLFSLFWLLFCVIIPLIDKVSRKTSSFFKNAALPIAPLWIGALFLTNYFAFHVISYFLSDSPGDVLSSLNELKESNYAVIFGFFAFHELRKMLSMRTLVE